MSQMGSLSMVSLTGAVNTLTGNIGGPVSPDLAGNINVVGGNNITTTGGLNTLTIDVTGTTNHAVQIGNASGSLTSISVGTDGQVLIGATGADPAFATLTSGTGTIIFTPGPNSLDLEAVTSSTSAVTYQARSSSGSISIGQLVQINGFNGGLNLPLVHLADSDTSNVPVHGIAITNFNTTTTGLVQICGVVQGVDTSLFPVGSVLYLQPTPGTFDINPPDGELNALNPIGSVLKSAVSGWILLNTPANVVQAPNLNNHNIFIGNPSGDTITKTISNGIVSYSTATGNFSGSTVTQNGALYGGASNTVSSTSVGTNGQVLLGATAAAPAFASLTSTGGTVTFTTGANSLNLEVSSPTLAVVDVTGTTQAMAVNTIYIADNAGLVTLTLPAIAAQGSFIRIIGQGAGGWTIAQNAGQKINMGSSSSTIGVTGSLSSTQRYDAVELFCTAGNNVFNVISSQGNITII